MKTLILITILILPAQAVEAATSASAKRLPEKVKMAATDVAYDANVPISVEYFRTGREDDVAAQTLGQAEVDNVNPCVLKMQRELQAFESRQELGDAVRAVRSSFNDPSAQPFLVLFYVNESMELRFEMRTPIQKDHKGVITDHGRTEFRKRVILSDRPGTWQERIDGDRCHVTEGKFTALIDVLREADRLSACIDRKKELLASSVRVSNYIHNYLPVSWIDEARKHLEAQNAPAGDLLREDTNVYRQGDSSFRECVKGLMLLEEEAASSVRVVNEVQAEKKGTDIPSQQIRELENMLSGRKN